MTVVEVSCGESTHRIRVDGWRAVACDHDLRLERAAAGFGAARPRCLQIVGMVSRLRRWGTSEGIDPVPVVVLAGLIGPDRTRKLVRAGVVTPQMYRSIRAAGVTDTELDSWAAFVKTAVPVEWMTDDGFRQRPWVAAKWATTGLRLADVRVWIGAVGEDGWSWLTAGFSLQEAQAWNKVRFSPKKATQWRSYGHRPDEAVVLHRHQFDPDAPWVTVSGVDVRVGMTRSGLPAAHPSDKTHSRSVQVINTVRELVVGAYADGWTPDRDEWVREITAALTVATDPDRAQADPASLLVARLPGPDRDTDRFVSLKTPMQLGRDTALPSPDRDRRRRWVQDHLSQLRPDMQVASIQDWLPAGVDIYGWRRPTGKVFHLSEAHTTGRVHHLRMTETQNASICSECAMWEVGSPSAVAVRAALLTRSVDRLVTIFEPPPRQFPRRWHHERLVLHEIDLLLQALVDLTDEHRDDVTGLPSLLEQATTRREFFVQQWQTASGTVTEDDLCADATRFLIETSNDPNRVIDRYLDGYPTADNTTDTAVGGVPSGRFDRVTWETFPETAQQVVRDMLACDSPDTRFVDACCRHNDTSPRLVVGFTRFGWARYDDRLSVIPVDLCPGPVAVAWTDPVDAVPQGLFAAVVPAVTADAVIGSCPSGGAYQWSVTDPDLSPLALLSAAVDGIPQPFHPFRDQHRVVRDAAAVIATRLDAEPLPPQTR